MNGLHLLRKAANERIDGEASNTRDVHAQYAQAGKLWYEPTHELPRTGAQIESAQARTRAQKLYDSAEKG